MKLKIFPRAKIETKDAIYFYEARKKGLGLGFLNEIKRTYAFILEQPELFPERKDQFREAIVSHFPYIIIFKIESNSAVITSIFHTSRNPNKKPL